MYTYVAKKYFYVQCRADAICDKPHHEPRSTYYNLDSCLGLSAKRTR